MLKFWRNPEFVRHARAELRGPRAITAALLALGICALIALGCWSGEHSDYRRFFKNFNVSLVIAQFVFAALWGITTCGQAISRERELKTFDFLRTTRLTSAEILIGKITGVPILAYFVLACTFPVSFVAGIVGGLHPVKLLGIYLLLVTLTLFVSLVGLTASMLLEKSGSILLALFVLWPMTSMYGLGDSPFPGFGGLSVVPAIMGLYGESSFHPPRIFGLEASYFVVTLFLYISFGAWLVLMLRRNLKNDADKVRLLTRWGAVGFAIYLNVLFYAFLDPGMLAIKPDYHRIEPASVSQMIVVLNGVLLLFLGLSTLTPQERLKIWYRRRSIGQEGYFSDSGLSWPWLLMAGLAAMLLLGAETAGLQPAFKLEDWKLGAATIELSMILVFVIRDVLFIQWCNVTRLKRPLLKGFLYLCLYYAAIGVLAAVLNVAGDSYALKAAQIATPIGPFLEEGSLGLKSTPWIFAGLVVQVLASFLIIQLIYGRVRRPAILPTSNS